MIKKLTKLNKKINKHNSHYNHAQKGTTCTKRTLERGGKYS